LPRSITVPLRRYFSRFFRKDLMAGLTVGVISLPLAIAFAIASGVKPEYGIYTTVIAACIVAIFGGSRYQVAGPTGAFIPILLSIVLTYGYDNLLLAGLISGILLIAMGLLKLGSLIQYIPRPVTIGFTAGIAVTIFTGQIPNFLGLSGLERHESFIANMQEIITHLDTTNPYSILTAAICFITIKVTPRFFPKIPGSLFGLLLSTIIVTLLYPQKVSTIVSVFGGIPNSLPSLAVPSLSWEKARQLLRPAFAIAMLGAIESLLSAVVADGMTGRRHNSNRELIGQGIANVLIPFFGGIPATGAIARTATNIKTGAATHYSAVISGIFVLIVMLCIAPYAGLIPLASMAPVLMIVSYNMSEHHAFMDLIKTRSHSTVILIITFFLTVLTDLTIAIEIGLLLAMIIFVKRMGDIMVVTRVLPNENDYLVDIDEETESETNDCPQISIFNIEGALFFGAAQMFSQSVMNIIDYKPKVVIFRMSQVPFMDHTGESHLAGIIADLQRRGIVVLIAGLHDQSAKVMHRSGLDKMIGLEHFFPHTRDAISHAAHELIDKDTCRQCRQNTFKPCLGRKD